MSSQLENLIELQKTDTNLRKLKKSIETAEQRRASIEQEFEQHAFEIRTIENKRDEAKAERAKLETQITDAKNKVERADRNLKNSQNQKEYEAAMRELDVLQKEISALETKVLEQLTIIEENEGILNERAEEISGLEGNRTKALADFESQLAKDVAEFESQNVHREKIFKLLPPQMASIYNRLVQRSRDGIAVAEVTNGTCQACFMALRPQIVVEIRRGDKIITCESCTRIMYIR